MYIVKIFKSPLKLRSPIDGRYERRPLTLVLAELITRLDSFKQIRSKDELQCSQFHVPLIWQTAHCRSAHWRPDSIIECIAFFVGFFFVKDVQFRPIVDCFERDAAAAAWPRCSFLLPPPTPSFADFLADFSSILSRWFALTISPPFCSCSLISNWVSTVSFAGNTGK